MKTRLLTLACFCWLALTAFAEPIPAFTQYTWLFQTNATAAQARAYLGITGAGGSTNWVDIGGTNSTLSGIALIGTNAPPTGLSNTNTTVLWLNGGIGFNTNVVDGPAWGTNGAGMIYRHTGELAIDPGFVFRGHGYVFEDDATNWRLLITTNGVNVGQIHSPTYMPLNMLEVGSDVGGPPCGFLVGNDFVGKSNAPPNGAMIEGALKVYGDIYADVYRDAAGNVLLYNNIGGGYLELGQQTGSQEIHFWSFGADQMHLNSAGTLVMQGLNTIQTYGGITTPLISGPTNITLRANGTNWWLVSQAGTLLGLTGTETINAGGGASLGLANITNNLTFPGTNTAGLVLRNLTTAQMNALPTPPAGAMAFNTDSNRFVAWDGSAWHQRVRLDGDTMYGALAILTLTPTNNLVGIGNGGTLVPATLGMATNALGLTGSTSTFLRSDGTQVAPPAGGLTNTWRWREFSAGEMLAAPTTAPYYPANYVQWIPSGSTLAFDAWSFFGDPTLRQTNAVELHWQPPITWDANTNNLKLMLWFANTNASLNLTSNVVWSIRAASLSSGANLATDVFTGTAVTNVASFTNVTANYLMASAPIGGPLWFPSAPTTNEVVVFRLARIQDGTVDTVTNSVFLLKAVLQYNEISTGPTLW